MVFRQKMVWITKQLDKLNPEQTILDIGASPSEWSSLATQFAGTVVSSQHTVLKIRASSNLLSY